MPNLIDLSGVRFGRLVVQCRTVSARKHAVTWSCICDCGTTSVKCTKELRNGDARSCGCLRREKSGEKTRSHGMSGSTTYGSWLSMWKRCTSPEPKDIEVYAGISVCERWKSFANFLADMGERPNGMTLDRYPDACGSYVPGNCRWATPVEQSRNKRRIRRSGLRNGVGIDKKSGKWRARIGVGVRRIPLGFFDSYEEAVSARDVAETEIWGVGRYLDGEAA